MSSIRADGPRRRRGSKYIRIAEDIAAQILAGDLHPDDQLKNERALAEHYDVSFHTLRHAIKELRDNWGMIETEHGNGNFVKEPPYTPPEGMKPRRYDPA